MGVKLGGPYDNKDGSVVYVFRCPGCGVDRPYTVPRWDWNGSLEKPTFSPSLLCNASTPELRCHLFVREGRIEYCGDSHHELAGKTVEMPDWGDE